MKCVGWFSWMFVYNGPYCLVHGFISGITNINVFYYSFIRVTNVPVQGVLFNILGSFLDFFH